MPFIFTFISVSSSIDMVSFYTLPSTVMHHPVHRSIKAAYSYYNVPGKKKLVDLMRNALIAARNVSDSYSHFLNLDYLSNQIILQDGFDVFNALDLMENKSFLEELKFGIGDGNLQYYLYNWKCPSIPPEKVS